MDQIDWFKVVLDNFLGFMIGTVLLGTVFDLIRRIIDYFWNMKYRGWSLEVTPADPTRKKYRHDLLWDEVRRFEQSRFECRKFIQSVCTSEGVRLSAGEIKLDGENGWVVRDKDNRTFRFDFKKENKLHHGAAPSSN
jgi:hypothetical protein